MDLCIWAPWGSLWESPWQRRQGRGISLSVLGWCWSHETKHHGNKFWLESTKARNSECRGGARASTRGGISSDSSHLNILPLWVCNTPNFCFKIIFACNFTIEMCCLFLFCWLFYVKKKNYIKTYMWSTIVFLATPQDRIKYKFNK